MSEDFYETFALRLIAEMEAIDPPDQLIWIQQKAASLNIGPQEKALVAGFVTATVVAAKQGGIKVPKQQNWEKPVIVALGVSFLITMIVLAIWYPEPSNFQYNIFRTILAIMIAAVAAIIPGFLDVKLGGWLRAGGALAVFVIVYFFSPASLAIQ